MHKYTQRKSTLALVCRVFGSEVFCFSYLHRQPNKQPNVIGKSKAINQAQTQTHRHIHKYMSKCMEALAHVLAQIYTHTQAHRLKLENEIFELRTMRCADLPYLYCLYSHKSIQINGIIRNEIFTAPSPLFPWTVSTFQFARIDAHAHFTIQNSHSKRRKIIIAKCCELCECLFLLLSFSPFDSIQL